MSENSRDMSLKREAAAHLTRLVKMNEKVVYDDKKMIEVLDTISSEDSRKRRSTSKRLHTKSL